MDQHFSFSASDLKHYPHFDKRLSLKKIESLVTSPDRVAANTFYPFFLFHEEWQPYRSAASGKPEKKTRPIRYGARRDAYIFTHYRRILSEKYEQELVSRDLSSCPIAYRKIPKGHGNGGKCNIDFAKDAFDKIDQLANCVAVALDIKGYFENLDHKKIKDIWCYLLGVETLPDDHYAVFKNITRYRFVDQREVYRRLGYIGLVQRGKYVVEGFKVPYSDMPVQICTPAEFREKICGGDPSLPSLIRKNTEHYGVPQGAPISDLIANFYLLDFDVSMKKFADDRGGLYMRYSDDILFVLPGGSEVGVAAESHADEELRKHGDHLEIKQAKTCMVSFSSSGDQLACEHIQGPQGKNGFEYLGFRYDGRNVYVRDSTIGRLYRKVATSARRSAMQHMEKNKSKKLSELQSSFDYSLLNQKFNRVAKKDFESDNYRSWTFYSYIKRASNAFGEKGKKIPKQVSGFDSFMKARVHSALKATYEKRYPQAAAAEAFADLEPPNGS